MEHYGINEYSQPSSRKREKLRAVTMLSEYQQYGFVLRRKCIKDESVPKQFQQIVLSFNQYCQKRNLTAGTRRQLNIHIRNFAKYLDSHGVHSVDEIGTTEIQGFFMTLSAYSKATVSYVMYTLRSLLRFAYEEGYHTKDLSPMCPTVQYCRNARLPSVFSEDEIQSVLDAVDQGSPLGKRDYAILLLAARLGIRVGDICNLTFENFKWDTKQIEFTQLKTGYTVRLPLSEEVGWAVIQYLRDGRPQTSSPNLFVRHNAPYERFSDENNLSSVIIKYLRAAGITC